MKFRALYPFVFLSTSLRSVTSALTLCLLASVGGAFAAAPALDNTGYAPPYFANGYWGGWANGMNGGYGFAPWQLTTTSPDYRENGFSINYASQNGGQPDYYQNTIDVFIGSWNLSAKDGNTASAVRPFTVGGSNDSNVLGVGQQLKVSMDNGYVNESGNSAVGFGLQNSDGVNRLEFYFVGGRSDYTLNIGGTEIDTGIPWSQHGFNFTFTDLNAAGAFSLLVHPLDGVDHLLTGITLASDISQIRLFNYNSDPIGIATYNNQYPTPFYQLYFNRLEIDNAIAVPEPSTLALIVIGTGLWAIRMRRRTPC
jgi:hypothetical protein